MIETERREQVLQAEAAIRQLSERMAEHISARQAAEEAAAHFRKGSEVVAESHATLRASADILSEAQKSFDASYQALRAVTRACSEESEAIRGSNLVAIADIGKQCAKLGSAATAIQTAGEIVQRNCAVFLGEIEAHKTAILDSGERFVSAVESQTRAAGEYGRKQSEALDSSHQLLAARLTANSDVLSQTLTQSSSSLAVCVETLSRNLVAMGREQEALHQSLLGRVNLLGGVCALLLLSIVGILTLR